MEWLPPRTKETVEEGIINEIGGLKEALGKLYKLIENNKKWKYNIDKIQKVIIENKNIS